MLHVPLIRIRDLDGEEEIAAGIAPRELVAALGRAEVTRPFLVSARVQAQRHAVGTQHIVAAHEVQAALGLADQHAVGDGQFDAHRSHGPGMIGKRIARGRAGEGGGGQGGGECQERFQRHLVTKQLLMTTHSIETDGAANNGSRHSLGCSMQQECRSQTIMTSRRGSRTGSPRRHWLAAVAMVCALAGCAALPEDSPVMEVLDDETGVTITRLGKPVELYRETFLRQGTGRFAFIAPFETNLMGRRALYLWVALPLDPAPNAEPQIELDGAPLALTGMSRDAASAGLRRSPYKIPTPWSAMFYYPVDEALVAQLGKANGISLSVFEATKDGAVRTLFTAPVAETALKDFAAR
jgi:hypothetical protein